MSVAPIATSVLTHVVKSIVDDPNAVQVEGFDEGENKVLLEVAKIGRAHV